MRLIPARNFFAIGRELFPPVPVIRPEPAAAAAEDRCGPRTEENHHESTRRLFILERHPALRLHAEAGRTRIHLPQTRLPLGYSRPRGRAPRRSRRCLYRA